MRSSCEYISIETPKRELFHRPEMFFAVRLLDDAYADYLDFHSW